MLSVSLLLFVVYGQDNPPTQTVGGQYHAVILPVHVVTNFLSSFHKGLLWLSVSFLLLQFYQHIPAGIKMHIEKQIDINFASEFQQYKKLRVLCNHLYSIKVIYRQIIFVLKVQIIL